MVRYVLFVCEIGLHTNDEDMKKRRPEMVEGQNERFFSFISELAEQFKPIYILKFGEVTIGRIACSSFMPEQNDSTFHYYLLMVMGGLNRIEHCVQDFVNTHFSSGKISILVHSRDSMDSAIAANNGFFINVLNTGILIYSHDGTMGMFPEHQLDTKIALGKARKHLYHRIPMAQGFLDGAGECFRNGKYNVCVFMLHQVVEQSCIALIRVFMAYRSDIHHLGRLLDICACFSERPREHMRCTPDHIRLFEQLINSYSHARYKDNFNVEMGDADKLYRLVHDFVILATELCEKKIAVLEGEYNDDQPEKGETENG